MQDGLKEVQNEIFFKKRVDRRSRDRGGFDKDRLGCREVPPPFWCCGAGIVAEHAFH